ncbi:Translocation and assembly module TamB [Tepidimonas sediminis]|uniref:Translocation and assembly module TamB n=1 Tax=Tepidimonas sediminis TaxID=2588941 RepID=A0A554WK50_9BURK|nr:translocation/assembly module TamB domain-containing protein [Tepidimonas sediminis]TSE23953.1 Translocation and assembly module TamB [Tepidimonas sediminis]
METAGDVHGTRTAVPASHRRRALRGRVLPLLALLPGLLAAALLALLLWGLREGSLAQVLRWGQPWLNRTADVQWHGVRGALLRDGRIERLQWQQDGLTVTLEGLSWRWADDLWARLWRQRRLALAELRAERVTVDDRRPPAPRTPPPADLRLPWLHALETPLHAGEVHIAPGWWLGDVAADFRYGPTADENPSAPPAHRLILHAATLRAVGPQGHLTAHLQGTLALQAAGAQTLELRAEAHAEVTPRDAPRQRWTLQARLDGPLAGQTATLQLHGEVQQADRGPGHATVHASLRPWAPQPVRAATAQVRTLDLALLWPHAPRTRLHGELRWTPEGEDGWTVSAQLRNDRPAAWDRGGLPLTTLRAQARLQGQRLEVEELSAGIGPGRLQARGALQLAPQPSPWGRLPVQPLTLVLTVRDLAPRQLWSTAPATPVQADLTLAAGAVAAQRTVTLRVDDGVMRLQAAAHWAGAQLSVTALRLLGDGLQAELDGELPLGAGQANRSAGGTLRLELEDVARAQASARRWLALWPQADAGGSGTAALRIAEGWRGRASLRLQWGPRLPGRDPQASPWQLHLALASLRPPAGPDPGWAVHDAWLTLTGEARRAHAEVDAIVEFGGRRARLTLEPTPLAWSAEALQVAPSALRLQPVHPAAPPPARLAWHALQRHGDGRWLAEGEAALAALPAWLAWWGRPVPADAPLQPSAELALRLAWRLDVDERAPLAPHALRAGLRRTAGDVLLQPDGPQGPRLAAGLRAADLSLDWDGRRWQAQLAWDSERAGRFDGALQVQPPQAWPLPPTTPLLGHWALHAPPLSLFGPWLPPGWRVEGRLQGRGRLHGTWAQPAVDGELEGDGLRLASLADGIDWRDGTLHARFDGTALELLALRLPNTGGPPDGGLEIRGRIGWQDGVGRARADLTLQARRWVALARADRQLQLSGQLGVQAAERRLALSGRLVADRARLRLPPADAPRLDDDVVVRGQPAPKEAVRSPWPAGWDGRADIALDLGEDTRLEGRGLDAGLRGTLQWRQEGRQPARLDGEVQTVRGRYQAWGQTLEIEHGRLRFGGALDDPALDVRAVRRFSGQTVGVQVDGSAQAPRVRLVAEPALPDTDILAWLVLGRPLAGAGAEAAILQRAALALLEQSRGGRPALPATLGLDELGVDAGGTQPDGSVRAASISLGKRLSNRLYLGYERSLSGLVGTVSVLYDVSRFLTLRGRAGDDRALELLYRRRYD